MKAKAISFKPVRAFVLVILGIHVTAYSQEYISPTQPVETGKAPGVKIKLLSTHGQTKNYVLIFAMGDEVRSGLTEFAQRYQVKTAHFTAIGDAISTKFGFFDYDRKLFKGVPISEPSEVSSLTGNIAVLNGKPVSNNPCCRTNFKAVKVAVLYQAGGPENFVLEERPLPTPTGEWVLIKVKAFGLNRSELMTRKGYSPNVKFPRVLGIECVGEVEVDPSGEYAKGQPVLALMGGMGREFDGSYAQYTLLPRSLLHPFQSKLPWETLGAIPEMFQTVHGSLYLALGIQKGETLLIRGGTSSVGMLAAQLANQMGLTVLATTRNPQKEKALLENGATHVLIDSGKVNEMVRAIFPQGIDKVLELVGTSTLHDSMSCLKPGGTACMSGMLAESWTIPNFAPMEFIPATVRLTTYDSGQVRSPTAIFQDFIRQVETGQVKLALSQTFTLDQIVAAHQLMDSNQAAGKLVVLP